MQVDQHFDADGVVQPPRTSLVCDFDDDTIQTGLDWGPSKATLEHTFANARGDRSSNIAHSAGHAERTQSDATRDQIL